MSNIESGSIGSVRITEESPGDKRGLKNLMEWTSVFISDNGCCD